MLWIFMYQIKDLIEISKPNDGFTDRIFLVRFDIQATKFPDLPLCKHFSATSE